MRLRQLSRKLEIKTDKIIEFLSNAGHAMENDANGKLTAEQVVLVEAEFPTPFIEEIIEEEKVVEIEEGKEEPMVAAIETPIEEEEIVLIDEELAAPLFEKDDSIELEVPLAPPSDVTSQVSEEIVTPVEEIIETPAPAVRLFKAVEEPEDDPNIELIKAPTVKLEGLKVLGKIDLPEPKPKVEPEKEETTKEQTPRRKVRQVQKSRDSIRDQHENPVEKERLRQQKISARRKREAEQKLKKKKADNYRQQLKSKPKAPSKPKPKKKVIAKTVIERTSAPVLGQNRPKKEAPKVNKLKKLWGWLNGGSDKF
jgi:hypothetical protein